jgi:hypothetical protein
VTRPIAQAVVPFRAIDAHRTGDALPAREPDGNEQFGGDVVPRIAARFVVRQRNNDDVLPVVEDCAGTVSIERFEWEKTWLGVQQLSHTLAAGHVRAGLGDKEVAWRRIAI